MRVDLFDFELANDRIALRPARPRDSARLLVVNGDAIDDCQMLDLPELLEPGDVLVFNDTKVIPAQLEGRRGEAQIGATLHKREGPREWRAFLRNARRARVGDTIDFGEGVAASVIDKAADGSALLHFQGDEPVELLLERAGRMPLPPYIASKREADEADRADYQTMFARKEGAVAAPTAALHFTPRLFERLEARGVGRAFVTLHVGLGTFQPIQSDDVTQHRMHREWGELPAVTAEAITACRARGGRVVAVGTTTVRVLETVAATGPIRPWSGETELFIYPPCEFRVVDALLTNFHLPRSTLLLLVGAFAGVELTRRAYRTAVEQAYRFYSYGDAMLIV